MISYKLVWPYILPPFFVFIEYEKILTANCSNNTVYIGLYKLTPSGKILMYCLFVSVILVWVLRSVGVFQQSIANLINVKAISNFIVFKTSGDGSPRSAGSFYYWSRGNLTTLGTRGFSRLQREFSLLAEGRSHDRRSREKNLRGFSRGSL